MYTRTHVYVYVYTHTHLLVDVSLIVGSGEVSDDWSGATETLEGGVHVACVAKVT